MNNSYYITDTKTLRDLVIYQNIIYLLYKNILSYNIHTKNIR